MAKKYYIAGNLIASPGSLYARDVSAGEPVPPIGAEVIVSERGELWLTKDTGSIFDTYYVNGEVAAGGGENGEIYAFKDIYEFTVRDYKEGISRLRGLLEVIVPSEYQLLFIELVNQLVYHNPFRVRNLFREAFDIDVDLSSLIDD